MIGAPGSTLQEPAKTTHYGNPWWTAFYLGFMLTVLVFQTVLTIWLLVGGLHNHNAAPLLTGMLLAPALVFELLVILVLLVRHPSRLWRTIVVTPSELRLPDPKWKRVPISDIAGVGLARDQKIRGSKRGRGLQRSGGLTAPMSTSVALGSSLPNKIRLRHGQRRSSPTSTGA